MSLITIFQTGSRLLDLLFEYNRIPVRILDPARRVLYSSFDTESFQNTDFSSGLYRRYIREDDCQPTLCVLNAMEMMAFFPFTYQERTHYLAVGPALLVRPYSLERSHSLSFFPPLKSDELEKIICMTPVVSVTQFAGFVRLLYTAFTDRDITVRELIEHSAEITTPHSISQALSTSVFEQRESETVHTPYAQELLLLNAIKSGELNNLEYFASAFMPQSALRLSADPLRQAVYYFVGAVTLTTRFAVEGGLDEELAFNMCRVYIQKADQCKTPLEVTSLLYTAASDFTERIRQQKQHISYSEHIVRCTGYIFHHLHEPVTLEALSAETGLSPAYLSVLFKKETGMALADFIQLQRIEEAKNLLRFSDYQISEISTFLAFSSQSYFTSVFKRHTGVTPKKYREANYRKNW